MSYNTLILLTLCVYNDWNMGRLPTSVWYKGNSILRRQLFHRI